MVVKGNNANRILRLRRRERSVENDNWIVITRRLNMRIGKECEVFN
jgi:hypothetical protein